MKKILVIGSGTMGQGIAQWFCQQKVDVQLYDLNSAVTKNALKKIKSSWSKLQLKNKFTENEVNNFNDHLKSIDQIELKF